MDSSRSGIGARSSSIALRNSAAPGAAHRGSGLGRGHNESSCPVARSSSRGSSDGDDEKSGSAHDSAEFIWPSTVPPWDDETQMLVLKVRTEGCPAVGRRDTDAMLALELKRE